MMATNNVSCPVWMDWFHGGLQYQIEHHLFPDLPRHHLRAASAYVRPMCENLGIKYHSPTFFQVGFYPLSDMARVHRNCMSGVRK